MRNTKYKSLILILFIGIINAQNTYVPDDNFEQALIDQGYDDILDDYVLTSNISNVDEIYIDNLDIYDLTGIEDFVALEILFAEGNQITSVDLSSNTLLYRLGLSRNNLTSIDVSSHINLDVLHLAENDLSSIDVSANTLLTVLYLNSNNLTSIDLSNNIDLLVLELAQNDLSSINVSTLSSLYDLVIHGNQLTSLDITSNTSLQNLTCYSNQISSLDISNLSQLTRLGANSNQLTTIDISNSPLLSSLGLSDNNLTSLDVSNNPLLTEIECGGYGSQRIGSLDVSNNPELYKLYFGGQALTALELSANTNLHILQIQDNSLTTIDVSQNPNLTEINISGNQLTTLDVSNNTVLTYLDCGFNALTSLDVSTNTTLATLECGSTQITNLDLSNNLALAYLGCGDGQLTSLDLSSNTAINQLFCNNNQLTYLNMKNGITDQLSNFNATNNSLTCIETLDPAYAADRWTAENNAIDQGVVFDVICGAEARTNWYVSNNGSDNSGSGTVGSPLGNIQTAINAATNGDTVSVAAGTYFENINFNGKNISLIGADSSNTIIDGGQNGSVVTFNSAENNSSVLKNFTITNGSGFIIPDGSTKGGGIYASGAGPILENLIITGNAATRGGGVLSQGNNSMMLRNSRLYANSSIAGGGGLWLDGNFDSETFQTIDNVTIYNNSSSSMGGGIKLYNNRSKITNCSVKNNSGSNGGGVYSWKSQSTITNSFIDNNVTNNGQGGGLYATQSQTQVINSSISYNESIDDYGAGIYNISGLISIIESTVQGNTTNTRGGGIHSEGTLYISRSRVVDNYAGDTAGGIRICCGMSAEVYNTTIAGNNSSNGTSNGFELVGGPGFLTLKNSILWNSGAYEISMEENPEPWVLDVEYSVIRNGQDGILDSGYPYAWGDGNIETDPLLDGGHTLTIGSPSIDSGNPHPYFYDCDGTPNDMGFQGGCGTNVSTTNLDFGFVAVGDNRTRTITVHSDISNGGSSISTASSDNSQFTIGNDLPIVIDQHSQEEIQVTFSPSASGNQSGVITLEDINPGYSGDTGDFTFTGYGIDLSDGVVLVPSEVPTIQEAIDAASDGDQILVEEGVYYENVTIDKGISLMGVNRENTIIDAGGAGSALTFANGTGESAGLSGFTLQNGGGTYVSDWPNGYCGGGLFIASGAKPTITDIIVQNNYTDGHGSGIYVAGESGPTGLLLSNSIVRNNGNNGSGHQYGGGLQNGSSQTVLRNVTFYNNHSLGVGGAINDGNSMTIMNCLFYNNTSDYEGDALGMSGTKVFNSTFVNNGSSEITGNCVIKVNSNSLIENSILWNNHNSEVYVNDNLRIDYSVIEGGESSFSNPYSESFTIASILNYGDANLIQDPLLTNEEEGFLLSVGSPALNAGNSSGIYNDANGSRNDMGYQGGNGIGVSTETMDFGNTNGIDNSSTDINFGNTGVGTLKMKKLIFYSSRNASVNLSSYTTTNNQFYFLQPYLPVTLESGAKVYIEVLFEPNSSGEKNAELTFSLSNLSNNNGAVSVSGVAYDIPSGDINIPTDIPSIQAALDIVPNGKTIIVAPGEYFEYLYLSSGKQNVTLKSESGPNQTILNGSQSWKEHFIDINSSNFTLDGFTVKNHDLTAIRGYDAPNSTFKNLILKNNREYLFSSSTVENCLFTENYGNLRVQGRDGNNPYSNVFKNVTISGNDPGFQFLIAHQATAGWNGPDEEQWWDVVFVNSAFYETDGQGFLFQGDDYASARLYIYNSYYPNYHVTDLDGTAQVFTNSINESPYPYFNNPEMGDYSLSSYSPLIGAGSNTPAIDGVSFGVPVKDIVGNSRPNPSASNVDIGAYESSFGAPDYNPNKYVSNEGDNSNLGIITNPWKDIQYAINQAQEGDIINVTAGTYYENIDFMDKNISVLGEDMHTTIIDGGGLDVVVKIESGYYPRFENFTVTNGYSSENSVAAGIYTYGNDATIKNIIIKNNQGAGIHSYGVWSPSRYENLLVYGNQLGIRTGTNNEFVNCTVVNNSGLGIWSLSSNFSLINCIVEGNTEGQIQFRNADSPSQITVNYSNIEGSQSGIDVNSNGSIVWGAGNLNFDSQFVDSANDNYHLLAASKLINAGHPDSLDSDGTRTDMGVYPYFNSYSGPLWVVEASGGNDITGTGAGDNKFASIQAAINFASDGDSVSVWSGTYVENIDFRGRSIKVVGYQSNVGIDPVIQGAEGGGHVVKISNSESNQTLLSSFTIQNGDAYEGGGVYVNGTSPALEKLTIKNNSAYRGGGIYANSSSLIVESCIFSDNEAVDYGGALHSHGGSPTIKNSIIHNNTHTGSSWNGGGLSFFYGSDALVFNCTIEGNKNEISSYGSAILGISSDVKVVVANSIIWNNTWGSQNNNTFPVKGYDDAQIILQNCIIEGGYDGSGNLDQDPQFVDAINNDYELKEISPAISGASSDFTVDNITYYAPTSDLIGNPRPFPVGSAPDMGAIENERGRETNYNGPVWYVDDVGLPYANGGPGAPFGHFYQAIGSASDGDTVYVYEAIITENVDFSGKNIVIIGEDKETSIIDGDLAGSTITAINGENAVLKNLTITNGNLNWGGGVFVDNVTTLSIEDCIIKGNNAGQTGGGVAAENNSVVTIKNSVISNNTGGKGAGVSSYAGASITIDRSVIINNSAVTVAGAFYCYEGATISVSQSTVTNNSLPEITFAEEPSLSNQFSMEYSNFAGVADSVLQYGNDVVTWGNGNINVDPNFIDVDNENYHLLATSHLINAGHPDSLDSDGTRTDIGAFPYLNSYSGPKWYISENGNDLDATGSLESPFRSIQAGINFSDNSDSVMVASGFYFENIDFNGKNLFLFGENRENTFIDGGSNGIVLKLNNTSSNSFVENFTIRNGSGGQGTSNGAGIHCNGCTATLKNLHIIDNIQDQSGDGSAIYSLNGTLNMDVVNTYNNSGSYGTIGLVNSFATINNTIVSNNTVSNNGGGLYVNSSDVLVKNSLLSNNSADMGGGIFSNGSNLDVISSVVKDNSSSDRAGGIAADGSTILKISETLIHGNVSVSSGAGLALTSSTASIHNSTIANNTMTELSIFNGGSLFHLFGNSSLTFFQSTLSNPQPKIFRFEKINELDEINLSFHNSNVLGGQDSVATNETISEVGINFNWISSSNFDPDFIDADGSDFNLLAYSKLINGGHPDSLDSDGTRADIGAYPYLNSYTGPDWYVSESGNDLSATGASDDPFRSIQAALNFGSDEDTAFVSGGTYNENLVYRYDESENIRSVNLVGENRESTIIDAQNLSKGIMLPPNGYSNVLIKNFTIQNGSGNGEIESTNTYGGYGGGIMVGHNYEMVKLHNLIIKNCSVIAGSWGAKGGGIFSESSSLDIFNVFLHDNSSQEDGGGLYFEVNENKYLNINSTLIQNNSSSEKGGGVLIAGGIIDISNSEISFNNSSGSGGGIYTTNGTVGDISDIRILGNSASQGGGSFFIFADIDLDEIIFANNSSGEGSAFKMFESSIDVINSNFAGNTSDGNFGANNGSIFLHSSPNTLNLVNTVLTNNCEYEIVAQYPTSGTNEIFAEYSMLEGGNNFLLTENSNVIWGSGNLDVDPRFVNQDNLNFQLLASSELINAGHPDSLDSDGSRADIGVYPYFNSYSGPGWHISQNGNDSTATGSHDNPFLSIQSGINFSNPSDSVYVESGTYIENITVRKNINLIGEDRENTFIDGTGGRNVVTVESTSAFYINGFTIQNADLQEIEGLNSEGGGIRLLGNTGVVIDNILFQNNQANFGGALAIYGSPYTTVKNSIFTNNNSFQSTININSEGSFFKNCLFYGNTSSGSVIQYYNVQEENPTPAIIDQCTIVDNNEAGISASNAVGNDVYYITNSILENNIGDWAFEIGNFDNSTPVFHVSYSYVKGGNSSVADIDNSGNDNADGTMTVNWDNVFFELDPMFVDAQNANYQLSGDSQLIDAGQPDSLDADGTVADIGAFYYDQFGSPVRTKDIVTTQSGASIELDWTDAQESNFSYYNVYRSLDVEEDWYSATLHANAFSSVYIDEAVDEDVTYFYRVSTVDSDGDEGLLGFMRHGRLSFDNTSVKLSGAIGRAENLSPIYSGDPYTLEGFFKLDADETERNVFGFPTELMLKKSAVGDSIMLQLYKLNEATGQTFMVDTSWHHIAFTPIENNTIVWVDGYAAMTVDYLIGEIGSFQVTAEEYTVVDELRLSDIVRYNSGFIPVSNFGLDENTLGYWQMNEGSLDASLPALYDISGNGYHMHLSEHFEGSNTSTFEADVPQRTDVENAVVINEVMPNPSGSDGGKEWIEIHNRWFTPVHLKDWSIQGSGSNESHTFDPDLEVGSDGYALLGQTSDSSTNGGYTPDYAYGNTVSLSNFGENLRLNDASGTVVDEVDFDDTFPFGSGTSMELIRPDYDNSLASSWLAAGLPYGETGNSGTPGERNAAYSGSIVLDTNSIDYGFVTEGAESSLSFWIHNEGVADLVVSEISSMTEYYNLSLQSGVIVPDDSLEVSVTFSPQTVFVYIDTITIQTDDPYSPVNTIILTGSAINEFADIVVSGAGSDSLAEYQFPFTRLGYTRTLNLDVINIGTPALEIEEIILEGDPEFSIDVDASILLFQDTLSIPIVYTPSAEGENSATLIFGSNDPDEPTYTLSLSGQAAQNIILFVPSEYATISTAIDSAFAEDTVEVAPGAYTGSVNLLDKNLVFRGGGDPSETILQGDGTGPVITIEGGQSGLSRISNLTIIGGGGVQGGGIKIDGGSTPNLDRLIIAANAVSGNGGGISVLSGGATISNVTIGYNNASGNGGALYAAAGSVVSLSNSILWSNGSTEIGSFGNVATTYSLVAGGAEGEGNLDTDPLFVNGPGLDYSLQWESFAIDAGDPLLDSDADGTTVDIGAMAYDQSLQPPDPVVSFSGTGFNGYTELAWSPPMDPRGNINSDVVEYTLTRSVQGESYDTLAVLTPDVISYTDDGGESHLINAQDYYYSLVPTDTSGLVSLSNDTITVVPIGGTIAVQDTSQNFGAVDHDQTSTWNLFIENTGNGDLTISSLSLSSPWYSIEESSLIIPSGQVDSVLVTFSPDLTPGDMLDTLEMITDDLDSPNLQVFMSGASSWPVLAIDSSYMSFGDINVVDYKTMSVTISNDGNDTLFVDSIFVEDTLSGFSVSVSESRTSERIGGLVQANYFSSAILIPSGGLTRGSEQFSKIDNNKDNDIQKGRKTAGTHRANRLASPADSGMLDHILSSQRDAKHLSLIPLNEEMRNNRIRLSVHVMPGESIGLDVTFANVDTATVATTLEITSDDPMGNGNLSLPLTARSVAPILHLSDISYQFGNVLGDSMYTISISNIGTDTLNISDADLVYLVPLSVDAFNQSWDESTQAVLVPGEASDVTVTFAPELDGRYTTHFVLLSDSYQSEGDSLWITGMRLATQNIDYSGVLLDESSEQIITYENNGNGDLAIQSINSTSNNFSTDLTENWVIPSESSGTLNVTFTPTSRETFNGTINLISSLNNEIVGVTLSGEGWIVPTSDFAATSISVVTSKGDDLSFSLSLANNGDFPLDYETSVDADFAGWIWLDTDQTGQVEGTTGAEVDVNVMNTANLDQGVYSGNIYFNTNTGSNPQEILANTDTVEIFLNLLGDDSDLTDTTLTIPSGNTDPITFTDDSGESIGLTLDFVNSAGGEVSVQSVATLPPIDEDTPVIDPDGLLTEPVYPEQYYEISTTIEGDFVTDIGLSYDILAGINSPNTLRIAKRPGNSGPAESWQVISLSNTEIDTTTMQVVAKNQISFSQWALISNASDNSFTDTQGPAISGLGISPEQPGVLVDATISVNLDDDTGIDIVTLFYAQGGNTSYSSTTMTGSGGVYTGTIPGSSVTQNGLLYFVSAQDPLGFISVSDTLGASVSFASGTLTTNSASGSAYNTGLPANVWRLFSLPAVLDETGLTSVLDELGTQDNTVWRIFRYDDVSETYKDNPVDLNTAQSYWIYQKYEDNLLLSTPSGKTGDMSGMILTLKTGWNFIGSPYPFTVPINLDQVQFYGPITYGISGESWSSVVSELDPWNGYLIYNRTSSDQTITLDPSGGIQALLSRKIEEPGWIVSLGVSAGIYSDVTNSFGALELADDDIDWHDNPEMFLPGEGISLFFESDEERQYKISSDIRSHDNEMKVWNAFVKNNTQSEVELGWSFTQPADSEVAIRIVDLNTRRVVNPKTVSNLNLGQVDNRYDRGLKIVSGSESQVTAKVAEVLALVPEKLSVDGNYPNPFNPITTIKYGLPEPSDIRITIVNILGQEVAELRNGWQDIGRYEASWDGQSSNGSPMSSGVYFVMLSDGKTLKSHKIMLIK